MEAALRNEAETRARAAGAQDLTVTTVTDLREAEVEGQRMFIEAVLTVTASGRPRVAHPPGMAEGADGVSSGGLMMGLMSVGLVSVGFFRVSVSS